jgi:transposase-like protein
VTQDNVVKLIQPAEFSDPLTEVLREGARALLAQAVEAEVAAFLSGHADRQTEDGRQRLVRHGHRPERAIMTGLGPVAVRAPRIRDRTGAGESRIRFTSAILPPYARRSKSLEVLIPILYLKGISSGDFEDALSALLGPDAGGLSASSIARLKEAWSDEHARWSKRDLSANRYVYVWVDGIHVQARLEADAQCRLVIIGATPEGKKELVGLTDGVRESAQSWRELLLDLRRRGLSIGPELAVADGALGFWQALEEVWPKTRGQRCWVHTIRTQLRSGLPWAVSARLRGAQWDDMADLQTAIADDDALDDELQDRLLVGERRLVQAGVNAITKRLQAGAKGLGLDALATEVIALLLLALQGQALVSQMVAPLRQLGQGHRAGLVGVQ